METEQSAQGVELYVVVCIFDVFSVKYHNKVEIIRVKVEQNRELLVTQWSVNDKMSFSSSK